MTTEKAAKEATEVTENGAKRRLVQIPPIDGVPPAVVPVWPGESTEIWWYGSDDAYQWSLKYTAGTHSEVDCVEIEGCIVSDFDKAISTLKQVVDRQWEPRGRNVDIGRVKLVVHRAEIT